jgi:hypothetical protein
MNAVVKIEPRTDTYLVQYEQAVRCLQVCKDELSIEGLRPVDITVEALKARAKLCQDKRAEQAAYELEIEKARVAVWIANEIVKRDRPFVLSGSSGTTQRFLGVRGVLIRAGWSIADACAAARIGHATGIEIERLKRLKPKDSLTGISRRVPPGRGGKHGNKAASESYTMLMNGGFRLNSFRASLKVLDIAAIADALKGDERIKARRALTEIRDWCANAVKLLK